LPHRLHNFTEVRRLLTRSSCIFDNAEKITARFFLDLSLRGDVPALARGVSGEEVDEEEEYEGAKTVDCIASDIGVSGSAVAEVVVVDYDYQFRVRTDPEDGSYSDGEVGVLFGGEFSEYIIYVRAQRE
jgi:hypothetical protein